MEFPSILVTEINITFRFILKRKVFISFRSAKGLSELQLSKFKKNFKTNFIQLSIALLLMLKRINLNLNFMGIEEK